MKRGQFLRRGAAAAASLTVGGTLTSSAGAGTVVEWNRPLVRRHPDGRMEVLWWPGKGEVDKALQAELADRSPL